MQQLYPTIFRLAMDVLPIQGSAVPCERVFSSAKETTTPRRNRISPELMEALQVLKFSLKHGFSGLSFTEGTSRQCELEELEAVMHTDTSIPADVTGFIQSMFH